jgi:disulfide bond formation protein DsbB
MLIDMLPTLNLIVACGGLFVGVVTIALFFDLLFSGGRRFLPYVSTFAWPAIIIATTGSVALSLVYSEYFGFIPCSLCWLQRIAIYPQALLALIAFRVRDTVYFPLYGIGLSVFGLMVAVYQYIYQMRPKETLTSGLMPCLADGSNADCAVKVIDLFGFVTFPFLSGVTFLFLITLYFYQLRLARTIGT